MSNNEHNPSQEEQRNQATQSPVKTPSHETARTDRTDIERAVDDKAQSADTRSASEDHPETAEQVSEAPDSRHSDSLADVHPRGVDLINDMTLDNTVDTDGKNRDAQYQRPDPDNDIYSNATLEDTVPIPPDGLAGFDSRPQGNRPGIATEPGQTMVEHGIVDDVKVYKEPPDARVAGVRPDSADDDNPHTPVNHVRPARAVSFEPSPDQEPPRKH